MTTDNPFFATLRNGSLLTPAQRAELPALAGAFPDVPALARELVRRGWLTPYQANQIARGRADELSVGPYLLLDRLGSGGMGQVFKARQALLDRAVALKVLRSDLADEPQADARFLKEVRAAGRLAHPNIVVAHDAARAGKQLFLVMELVDGTDLARLVKQRGPLPAAEACEYVRQAALGLQHAHEAGLVHRDIKPGNLLLHVGADGRPVVKVADLGLALLRARPGADGQRTAAGAVMGTPDYIAPEQAADAGQVDIRADIYSLGCTLYHLLAGRPPFPDGSLAQKLMSHATAEPTPLEKLCALPAGLGAVVQRMMAKRPADRYPTPAAVAQALAPFAGAASTPLNGSAPSAADAPTVDEPRLTLTIARRRWPLLLLLAVPISLALLVCLGGAGFTLIRWLLSPGPLVVEDIQEPPKTEVTVTVVLRGLPPELGPDVTFVLDGQPIDRETLKRQTSVTLGKHTLKLMRGAAVVEVRVFDVRPEDRDRPVVLVPQEKGGAAGLLHICETKPICVTALTFSTDGRRLVAGGISNIHMASSPNLITWDAIKGEHLRRKSLYNGLWTGLAIAPDGRRLLSQRIPLSTGILYGDVESVSRQILAVLAAPEQQSLGIALSTENRRALAWTNDDQTWVWDLAAAVGDPKRIMPPLHKFSGGPACFTADGRRAFVVTIDALIEWDLTTGKEVARIDGLSGRTLCVAVSDDDRWAVTAATDSTLRLWNLATGKEQHHLRGHTGAVKAVAFTPDARRLVTGGADGTLRVWDVTTGAELHRFDAHKGAITCLAVSPGGKRAASGDNSTLVKIWQLPD